MDAASAVEVVSVPKMVGQFSLHREKVSIYSTCDHQCCALAAKLFEGKRLLCFWVGCIAKQGECPLQGTLA
jgi:hypothetical protein